MSSILDKKFEIVAAQNAIFDEFFPGRGKDTLTEEELLSLEAFPAYAVLEQQYRKLMNE